ncbi:MAG: hypothetical protein ACLFMT_02705 [Halobacteriales archaeon]
MKPTARTVKRCLYVGLAALLLTASVGGAPASAEGATAFQATDGDDGEDTENNSDDGERDDEARSIPGFWLVIGLIALLAIGLLVLRRKASAD